MDLVTRDNIEVLDGTLFDDNLSVDSNGGLRVLRLAADIAASAIETGTKAQKQLKLVALTTSNSHNQPSGNEIVKRLANRLTLHQMGLPNTKLPMKEVTKQQVGIRNMNFNNTNWIILKELDKKETCFHHAFTCHFRAIINLKFYHTAQLTVRPTWQHLPYASRYGLIDNRTYLEFSASQKV